MDLPLETKPPIPANFPVVCQEPQDDHFTNTGQQPRDSSTSSNRNNSIDSHDEEREISSHTVAHGKTTLRGLGRGFSKVLKHMRNLNPFRTTYTSLYRPLNTLDAYVLLALAIALGLAAGAPLPIIGFIFGKIINEFPLPPDELRVRLGQLLAAACAFFIVTWGWSVCWGIIGERLSRSFRLQTLHRLLGMDQAYYETENPDVTGLLTEKVQLIQLGTSEKVGLFLSSISYFIAAFAVSFYLHAKLAGILLATVIPAMAFIITIGTGMSSQYSKRATSRAEKATSLAENLVAAVRTVQATGSADLLCKRYDEEVHWRQYWSLRKALVGAVMLGGIYFVAYAANALAFYIGSRELRGQQSGEAGTIYAVIFLILDASFVVGQFGPFIQTFSSAAAAGDAIFALLDRPAPAIDTYSESGLEVSRLHFEENIMLKNVSFIYPSRPGFHSLDGLCLTIKPGTMTGIVGASGSGKSTVTNLLMRLYDPSSGQITLGSVDLRDCNVRSLRSHIALVGQEPVLFSGSIIDNIRAGIRRKTSTTEENLHDMCISAAHDAGCDEFVSALPQGYDTQIGTSGFTQLSGGQKQRIALARALVSDPSLLILDEYTSAMDAKSEALVLSRLQHRTSKCSVLIIAHRLVTVRHCQQILLLESGKVIDEGSHEFLIQREGPYQTLATAQALSNVDESLQIAKSDEKASTSAKPLDSQESSPEAGRSSPDQESAPTEVSDNGPVGLREALIRVLLMSRSNSPLIAIGILAATVSGGTLIGEAVIFGHLVELLNDPAMVSSRASFFCLMFFVVALAAFVAYSTSGFSFGIVSERLISNVQQRAIRTFLAQDIDWFSSTKHSPHHLISSMSADSGKLSGLSGPILGTVVSATVSVIGGIVVAHIVAWKIAIVLLACVPLMLLSGFLRLRILAKTEDRQQHAYRDATATASEACSNIRTIASLGTESEVLKRYKQDLDAPYKQGIKHTVFGNILLAFSLSITYFVYALAYWW